MTTIYGELKIAPEEYIASVTDGSTVLRDATVQYVSRAQEAAQAAMGLFVEGDTTNYQEMYTLPMSGELDEIAVGAASPPVDTVGRWTVAYPIRNFQNALAGSDVEIAYMTAAVYQDKVDGLVGRYATRLRRDIMRALFDNDPAPFIDPLRGSLAVRPLANEDGTLYPPPITSDTAQEYDNYQVAGYTAIDDTDNPFSGIIEPYFNSVFGYAPSMYFDAYINSAQRAEVEALEAFNRWVRPDVLVMEGTRYVGDMSFPDGRAGQVIGTVGGVRVSVWDYVPANYIVAVDPAVPAPLRRRVDPAGTNLGGGNLQLMGETLYDGNRFTSWRARFGFAAGNRLNGLIIQLKASGDYDVPAMYAGR